MDIEARAEQHAKAPYPMEVIEFGRLIDVIPLQLSNANFPMDVMVSGRITATNEGNAPYLLSNAKSPTEVKVLGIVIEVPSSERRRVASALVKTVILKEEGREGKGVLVMNHYVPIPIDRTIENPVDIRDYRRTGLKGYAPTSIMLGVKLQTSFVPQTFPTLLDNK